MIGFEIADFLKVRIQGYQYPDNNSYWDGNWLISDIELNLSGVFEPLTAPIVIAVMRPCLRADELPAFLGEIKALVAKTVCSAELKTLEPYFKLQIAKVDSAFVVNVKFREQGEKGSTEMSYPVEPSEVSDLITQLSLVVKSFPVRGRA
ncbi:hypothetical protein N9L47_02930 [Rhodobacteraceae bacterium]|nr:hypothetical protein [Paracoccaceae bacterium]